MKKVVIVGYILDISKIYISRKSKIQKKNFSLYFNVIMNCGHINKISFHVDLYTFNKSQIKNRNIFLNKSILGC